MAPGAGIHAWTGGAIGSMTIAVMTRASLGHTGQALKASVPRSDLRGYRDRCPGANLRRARARAFGGAAGDFRHRADGAVFGFALVYAPLLCRARNFLSHDDRRQHIAMDDELLRDGARLAVRGARR